MTWRVPSSALSQNSSLSNPNGILDVPTNSLLAVDICLILHSLVSIIPDYRDWGWGRLITSLDLLPSPKFYLPTFGCSGG